MLSSCHNTVSDSAGPAVTSSTGTAPALGPLTPPCSSVAVIPIAHPLTHFPTLISAPISFHIPIRVTDRGDTKRSLCPHSINPDPTKVTRSSPHRRMSSNLINIKTVPVPLAPLPVDLRCALLNIRSLSSKTFYINDFISHYSLHFFFLTECWLSSTASTVLIEASPPDYSFLFSARQDRTGGGLAVIFSNQFSCTACSLGNYTSFEYLAILVGSHQRILTLLIYRPPRYNPIFLTEFSEFLSFTLIKYDKIVLLGDLNFHVNDVLDTKATGFLDLLSGLGFTQHVTGPTHNHGNTLDLIFTKDITTDLPSILQVPVSDHSCIFFNLHPLALTTRSELIPHSFRIINNNVKSLFADLLPDKLESFSNTAMSVNVLTDSLNTTLSETLDTLAPLRTSRGTRSKSVPWFSDHTRSLKRACRRLEDRWRTSKSDSSRLAWTLSFKRYKRALSAARSSYFSNLIDTNQNNHRVLFNTVARLTQSSPTLNPAISANDFLEYFTDKISLIRSNITRQQSPISMSDQCPATTSSLSQFEPISAEALASLVAASKPTTCSLDPIPSDLCKELFPCLSGPLLSILNTSFAEGCVPLSYKFAIIKPLLKKPNSDPLVLANYRPVSTLPFFSKILERIVADQLTAHLSANNLFDSFQSGFRSRHSTETALTRVVNDLLITADSGSASLLLLLDLSSAFDSVDHCILLHRLKHCVGVHGLALSWFQSYLSNRTQCVSYNNSLSECSAVVSGVPQGSVLGPLLFCIYMLPLGGIIAEYGIQFHFYADDTQLYIPLQPNDPSQIQNLEFCVVRIKSWMSDNFLLLNTAKTDLLVIKPNNYKYFSEGLGLNIDGCFISENTVIRNLGVTFDPTLTFQSHIKEITKTAYFHLRNISKIRPSLSLRSAEVVLHALVSSRLDYCNVLFSGLPISTTRSLQIVQNSAARLLTKTSKFCHITPVLASLHWLPIQARADFKVLLLTFKALNGLAPLYLSQLLTPYTPSRPLRSLGLNLLVIPPINKKSAGGRAFSYRAPLLWNALPQNIRSTSSITIFKSRLKTHLFTQYFE